MAYETLNEFTEWCYNRYVDSYRENRFLAADLYHEVLKEHFRLNLKPGKFVAQRIKAKSLLKNIEEATKKGKLDKLTYTGEKGQLEFKKAIEEYEQYLKKLDYPPDYINELIIVKKEEFGNF